MVEGGDKARKTRRIVAAVCIHEGDDFHTSVESRDSREAGAAVPAARLRDDLRAGRSRPLGSAVARPIVHDDDLGEHAQGQGFERAVNSGFLIKRRDDEGNLGRHQTASYDAGAPLSIEECRMRRAGLRPRP
jgi:hypothetical protein